jgi:hypothetical protein
MAIFYDVSSFDLVIRVINNKNNQTKEREREAHVTIPPPLI